MRKSTRKHTPEANTQRNCSPFPYIFFISAPRLITIMRQSRKRRKRIRYIEKNRSKGAKLSFSSSEESFRKSPRVEQSAPLTHEGFNITALIHNQFDIKGTLPTRGAALTHSIIFSNAINSTIYCRLLRTSSKSGLRTLCVQFDAKVYVCCICSCVMLYLFDSNIVDVDL